MSSIMDETSQGSARQSLGGLPHVVTNLFALRQLLVTDLYGMAVTLGAATAGDGSGDTFYWNPADTTADNGITVIRPSLILQSQPGRWNIWNTSGGGGDIPPITPGSGALGIADSVAVAVGKTVLWTFQAAKGSNTYSCNIMANNDGTTPDNVESMTTITPGSGGTFDFTIVVDIVAGNMRLTVTPASSGWQFSCKRLAVIPP